MDTTRVGRSAAHNTAASKDLKLMMEKKTTAKTKSRSTPVHPPIAKMVNKAIESLNEKEGSSVRAIKKYVAYNYVVDAEKVAPFIKKYLSKAIENKTLLQTTGKGFNGSFKLASISAKKKVPLAKRHVTASKDAAAKKAPKPKKPQSKEGARKSMEKKSSKTSTSASAKKLFIYI